MAHARIHDELKVGGAIKAKRSLHDVLCGSVDELEGFTFRQFSKSVERSSLGFWHTLNPMRGTLARNTVSVTTTRTGVGSAATPAHASSARQTAEKLLQ